MEKVKALCIKRIIIPVLMFMFSLIIPNEFHSHSDLFSINSLLMSISYNPYNPYSSYWISLNLDHLFPALLIFTPCFVWLYMERDMSVPILLVSAGVVTLVMTLTLLLFLPAWAVFPWFSGGILAYVPEFIDLVPFSGLAFTIMVLLPLIWRGLIYPENQDRALRKKVSAVVLSVAILLFPMTMEIFSWQGTDINRNFFDGFSLNSATWTMSSRVSGNRWGQNTWFHFSTSSIFASLSLILQILPGIIFAWFVCRGSFERKRIAQMITAGLTHLLIVSLTCIWLNYTSSHAGIWVMTPFPALLIVGFIIFAVSYGKKRRRTGQSSGTDKVTEEENLSQLMV
jgi:hypothetical protein